MKTILITGANRLDGIGYHAAKQLVDRDNRVIITARTAEAGSAALAKLGNRAHCLPLDVSDPKAIASLPRMLQELTPILDVLINNAAILLDSNQSVLDLEATIMQETFAINSIAPVQVTRALLPLLKKSQSPRIINVSSGAGQLSHGEPENFAPAYGASKAALNALTQQLAAALPSFAVNSVCPGWCKTRMGGDQAPRTATQGADTICWLADEAPQSLTGKFLRDREEIVW